MKKIDAFTTDGFKASIEYPRFLREMDNGLREILSALIGSATVFIKGGNITVDSGNTTVTDGILFKDGDFYSFTGGTHNGILPSALKVKLIVQTASGYPVSYFGTTPIDIYKDYTAIIDATGTITLDTIGYISDLAYLKSKADLVDGKAGKNAKTTVSGVTVGAGFTSSLLYCNEYDDGTIFVHIGTSFSGTKSSGTVLLNNLPNSGSFLKRLVPVVLNDSSGNEISAYCQLVGNQLLLFDDFNSPYVACACSFEYKKA